MDIRCERCGSEYEIDEAKVPEGGASIKCATCQHTFKVLRPAAPTPSPEPQVMLRLVRSGKSTDVACPDETTLRTWIGENRVLRTDSISFDGATWTTLADVPELADAFPAKTLDRMHPTPRPTAPSSPERTPQLVSGAIASAKDFSDSTMPEIPKIPSLALPSDPPGSSETSSDIARTVQFRVDAPSSGSLRAAAAPTGDTGARLGKLNRPVEGAPPAAVPSPSFPSLSLPTDTTPPPPKAAELIAARPAPKAAPPAAKPVSAPPKPAAPTKPPSVTQSSAARASARPAEKTPTGPPKTRTAETPKPRTAETPKPRAAETPKPSLRDTPGPGEHTAYELALLQKRAQPGRMAAGIAAVVVVVGAAAFGFNWYRHNHIPEEAEAPYQEGRTAYLHDVRGKFDDAAAAYQKAIDEADPAPYPSALGGLAELHMAWGEQLWNKAQPLLRQAEEKKKALAKTPEDAALRQAATTLAKSGNELQGQATEHLQKGYDYAQKAIQANVAELSARRATLDYFRITNDVASGQKEEAVIVGQLKATDPETTAHVAAFDALDSKQLDTAILALKESISAKPELIRAWGWLADAHRREGKVAFALADLASLQKAEPTHEGAKEMLNVLKPPPPPPPAPSAGASGASAAPEPSTPEIDRMVKEGDQFFEKKKYQKALEAYEKVLAIKPNNVDANFGRGYALQEMKKLDPAIAAFQRTLELSPKFGDAMIALAEAYKAKGQKKDAVRYYQKYLDANPKGEQAAAARANVAALQR